MGSMESKRRMGRVKIGFEGVCGGSGRFADGGEVQRATRRGREEWRVRGVNGGRVTMRGE